MRDKFRAEITTPVQVISDSVNFFNGHLKEAQYFFTDIKKEGILLYDSGKFKLGEARELTLEQRIKKAEEDFELWFQSANEFFDTTFDDIGKGRYKKAAFELHQAVECFYSTVLLVLTNYKPKGHDLEEYGRLAASQEPILLTVFPRDTAEQIRRFELLQKAYVNARYNKKNYKITKEDLDWLVERVKKLQTLTEEVCKKGIESLKAQLNDKIKSVE